MRYVQQWFRRLMAAALFLTVAGTSASFAQSRDKFGDAIGKQLQFRSVGPALMGGRVDDIVALESNPSVVYVGMASGGVWKTVNAGTTWEPVFDNEEVSSIGDIAVAPSSSDTIWVGTGESNSRQSSSWGNGVYKSTDGGKSWSNMGLRETHHIARIVIHPTNPDILYVAALGHLWGPNKDRGVYKTTDGGKTWSNVKFINEDTGFVDIAIDPQSPNTLYAAAYQRRRSAYGFNGGGPGSGVYKTTDGGATWTKLTAGLPEGDTGRIGIDIYRRNPNIVYCVVENAKGGVFRSDDKGATWRKMSDTNPRPMYYSQVRIDPNNDLRIWVLGAPMFYSEDGGKTFATGLVQRIHGDYHAMWINPGNSDHMIVGSDGGIHWTYDRGRTWEYVNTQPLGQIYEIGLDMSTPYRICGGFQDNGAWCGPSATTYQQGISNDEWVRVGGGDGFYVQVDPADPSIVYSESQDGNVSRLNTKTSESKSIRPGPPEGEKPYRFQWNSPLLISAHDSKTIYYGGNFLFKSADRGDNWTRLGADLTTGAERDKLPIMGVLPGKETLSRHDGVQQFPTITTIAESGKNANVVWVGTDDGNLQVTRDGGKSWKNVAGKVSGVPQGTYVSRVIASSAVESRAYVTFDGHRNNDYTTHLYTTDDYGESWKSLAGNLPTTGGLHVLREHPNNPNLLFVGTEFGLSLSFDRGQHWTRLKNNLPTVPVDDIEIHARENDLVLGTHGRSAWVMDDITPLSQVSESVINSDLYLFDIRPAIAWRMYGHKGSTGHKLFLAPNPPYGAILNYYLKQKPGEKEEVKITISDKDGKVLRELKGTKETGINRASWDLRETPPVPPSPEQEQGFFGTPQGPRVLPGEYTVTITAGKNDVSRKVTVQDDPRISISEADRLAHYEATKRLMNLIRAVDQARRSIQTLKTSINGSLESVKKQPRPPEEVVKAGEAIVKELDEIAPQVFSQPQPLGNAGPPPAGTPVPLQQSVGRLSGSIVGYTARPSETDREQMAALQRAIKAVLNRLNKVIDESVPALNKLMSEKNLPYISLAQHIDAP